jgi:hypothetical protein
MENAMPSTFNTWQSYDTWCKEAFPITGDAFGDYLANNQVAQFNTMPSLEDAIQSADPPEGAHSPVDSLNESHVTTNTTPQVNESIDSSGNKQPDGATPTRRELVREFKLSQAEHRKLEKRCATITTAGLIVLSTCALSIVEDPRVATTMHEHLERSIVDFIVFTMMWPGVAAASCGAFGIATHRMQRREERGEHLKALQKIKKSTEATNDYAFAVAVNQPSQDS